MTGDARLAEPRAWWQELTSEFAIALAAVLYGATYLLVQDALDHTSPSAFNVLRFGLAAVVLAPFAARRGWRGPRPRVGDGMGTMLRAGVAIGVVAFVAYLAQNVGLEHTLSSNVAFITGLFAVFTPMFEYFVLRRSPTVWSAVAVAVAVAGLMLLTGARPTGNFGDAITLLAAAGFGLWFVQIGLFAPRFDVITLVTIQSATVCVLSIPFAALEGFGDGFGGVFSGDGAVQVWAAVVATGVGATAIAFSLSTWAQRRVEPSRASIINLLEPVVAGIFGYFVGERLGVDGTAGAALILVAMVVAEFGAWRRLQNLDEAPPHAG